MEEAVTVGVREYKVTPGEEIWQRPVKRAGLNDFEAAWTLVPSVPTDVKSELVKAGLIR